MSSSNAPTRSSPRSLRRLWDKVRDVEVAMLTTVDAAGALHSRPMATQAIEANEFLWFFAGRQSGKVQAILENPQVGLVYAAPGRNLYVMATGKARISDNDAKARALWSKAAQAWFPGGPADSGLVLIVVDVEHAQWWDGSDAGTLDLS